MKLSFLFLVLSLLVWPLHGAKWLNILFKGVMWTNAATEVTYMSVTMADTFSKGCAFRPNICTYRDEINELLIELEPKKTELLEKCKKIKELNSANIALYRLLEKTNTQNGHLSVALKSVELLYLEALQTISTFSGINPDDVIKEAEIPDNIKVPITDSLEEYANYYDKRNKRFWIFTFPSKLLWYGGLAGYKIYTLRQPTVSAQAVDASVSQQSVLRRTFTRMETIYTEATGTRWYKVGYIMYAGGFSAYMIYDMTITFEKSKELENELKEERDLLKQTLEGYTSVIAEADATFAEEETIKAEQEEQYEEIKKSFLEMYTLLTTELGDDAPGLPRFTESDITKTNIYSHQLLVTEWVETAREEARKINQGFVTMNLIKSMVNANVPLSNIVSIASAVDETVTEDIVLRSIAGLYPEMAAYDGRDLSEYRS